MSNASAERVMAALGITPYQQMPTGNDLIAFRHQQAEHAFTNVLPKLYRTAEPSHPDIHTWIGTYLADSDTCRPLLISGPAGVGKTWQAIGAIRRITLQLADRGKGLSWRITSQPELLEKLKPKTDRSHEGFLDRYLGAELLLVDDLGAGKPSDWTNETMYRLIEQRLTHCRPTIYTTNLAGDGLSATLGDRVMSRLRAADRVTIGGEDLRKTR